MVVESPNQLNLRSEIQPDESPISVWFLQCVILCPGHACVILHHIIVPRYLGHLMSGNGMAILSEDV